MSCIAELYSVHRRGAVPDTYWVNYALRYIADLSIPVKRGTFNRVSHRHDQRVSHRAQLQVGLFTPPSNIDNDDWECSQWRNGSRLRLRMTLCNGIREAMVRAMTREFSRLRPVLRHWRSNFHRCVSARLGQDVLSAVSREGGEFTEIHFFGDKTAPGGNDHELFLGSAGDWGNTVTGPADTIKQIEAIFF